MIGQQTALTGIAGRIAGRRATRTQALVTAVGAAVIAYRFLRSGADDEEDAAPHDTT